MGSGSGSGSGSFGGSSATSSPYLSSSCSFSSSSSPPPRLPSPTHCPRSGSGAGSGSGSGVGGFSSGFGSSFIALVFFFAPQKPQASSAALASDSAGFRIHQPGSTLGSSAASNESLLFLPFLGHYPKPVILWRGSAGGSGAGGGGASTGSGSGSEFQMLVFFFFFVFVVAVAKPKSKPSTFFLVLGLACERLQLRLFLPFLVSSRVPKDKPVLVLEFPPGVVLDDRGFWLFLPWMIMRPEPPADATRSLQLEVHAPNPDFFVSVVVSAVVSVEPNWKVERRTRIQLDVLEIVEGPGSRFNGGKPKVGGWLLLRGSNT